MAPVKAPLQWPKSSDSRRFSGRALQLMGMNGANWRRLLKWSARATSSLPVPLSPRIRMVLSVSATRSIILKTSCILGRIADELVELVFLLELFAEVDVFRNGVVVGQGALDAQAQIIHLERLLQVVERPFLHGVHRRLDGRVGGDEDDGGGRTERARLLQNLQTVRAGFVQIKVSDDQFGALRFEGFHRGVVVAEGKNLVAFPAEDFGDHLHHGHFVIKQQDFCHASRYCKPRRQQACPETGASFLMCCRKPGRST